MEKYKLSPHKTPPSGSITLVGMAGAGKSTVGKILAEKLGWAQIDTDSLLEAHFGTKLQSLFDSLGRDEFVKAEEAVVANLGANNCVISTGGSVIYGPKAVARLKELGPVVFLEVGLETAKARVGDASNRGLAIAPGQSFASLHQERQALYRQAADFTLNADSANPQDLADSIIHWLVKDT